MRGPIPLPSDGLSAAEQQRAYARVSQNFEYISPRPWVAGYQEAMGQALPFERLSSLLRERGGSVDVASLPADDPLRPPRAWAHGSG